MEWVETTGRTVEEAKEMALDILGVDEVDAEFEVIEEPKSGFLGISKKLARVKARIKPTTPRAKDTRRPRKRKPRPESEKPKTVKAPESIDSSGEGTDNSSDEVEVNSKDVRGARPARSNSRAGSRSPKRTPKSEIDEGKESEMEAETMSLAEQATVAQNFLAGILSEIGLEGTVSVHGIEEETINIGITGTDLGILIGPRGTVLSAVQDMTRTVVQRNSGGRSGRIVVDIDGYRDKRRVALESFAKKMAEEVRETGVSKVFEAMSSSDRKIVHDIIGETEGVVTRSEGYEPRRYVVVEPASAAEANDESEAN